MIIGRALASSVIGAVWLPVLEDWPAYAVQRGTYRRIADAHGVDLTDDAARNLFYGRTPPVKWHKLISTTLAYRMAKRTWRRLMIAFVATDRAKAAARYFSIATLFDHYCARLHLGMGLSAEQALVLRDVMNRAIEQTSGGLGWQLFKRGTLAAAKATVKAPLELADAASGGALRRLLGHKSEIEAAEEVEVTVARQISDESGLLARATTAIELELAAEKNPYLDELVDTFDRLWRQRRAETTV